MSKISDFTRLITKGTTPMTIGGRFIDSGVNFIKVESITESSTLEYKYLQKISIDINEKMKRSQLQENDLLVTIAGALGRTYIVEKNILPANTNQAVGIIRFNTEKCNPHYVKYWLHTSWIKKLIGNVNAQSIQNNLNLVNLGEIPLNNHNVTTQQKISSVLSTLDSKIELNNKINAELEAMAKTIYDYWFVQFDFPDKNGKPYKSSGGKMVWSEELKREIPGGWEVKKIGDLIDVKRGKNITRKTVIGGYIPVIAAGLEPSCYHNISNTSSPVITVSGSGANAGYIQLHNQKIWASDCSFIDKSMFEKIYTIYLLLIKKQNELYDMQKGSAQPHVYPQDIMNMKIVVDQNLEIFSEFEEVIVPMFTNIGKNKEENQKLSELRDWLLPMLMNGQVTVN